MILQIKLPDGVYEAYQKHNPLQPERAIEQQLLRFAGVNPADRILILPNLERNELEVLLDSHFSSAKELVSKVKETLGVNVEGVSVTLDPNTLFRLTQMAEFEGQEKKAYLEQKIKEGIQFTVDGGL